MRNYKKSFRVKRDGGFTFISLLRWSRRSCECESKGFTFIELILYVAIVSIMVGALIPFAWSVINLGADSSTQQEVYSQVRNISERLKYEIRNASGINSVTATSISLSTSTAATNPTVIDLSGGNLRIKQGSGAVTNLNSNAVTISSLVFTNFTSGDNKTKHIQFRFTMTDNYTSVRQEYIESQIVEGSAEVRSN